MSKLVCIFNLSELITDFSKSIAIARWGSKCKNSKTRVKIYKHCIKIVKNSKVNRSAMKIAIKS